MTAATETQHRYAYRHKRESEAQAIERRTALWSQMERIEAYLPVLRRQREEAATRLAEITDLIADEEAAVAEIREAVK